MPHATFETGFYDDAGNWQRLSGGESFGDNFGGWGSWDNLVAQLSKKNKGARVCSGRLEFPQWPNGPRDLAHLVTRFTLVDPAAFATARADASRAATAGGA